MAVAGVVPAPNSACFLSLSSEQVFSDKYLSVIDRLRILKFFHLRVRVLGVAGACIGEEKSH